MYPSRQDSGYLRPLTLPPPLTTFYGRNKQCQTQASHHPPPPSLLFLVVRWVRCSFSIQRSVLQVGPLLCSTPWPVPAIRCRTMQAP